MIIIFGEIWRNISKPNFNLIFESLEMKIKEFFKHNTFLKQKIGMFESPQITTVGPPDSICMIFYDSYCITRIFHSDFWPICTWYDWKWWKKKKDGSGSSLWYTLKGVTNELTIELSPNWINCFAWTLISTTRVL